MDDSSMDFTSVVPSSSELKRSLLLNQEKAEALFQENYELKKKIELMEQAIGDMEGELSFVSNAKSEENKKYSVLQTDLNTATSKITQLESQLDEEKLQVEELLRENEELKAKDTKVITTVVPDQEMINTLTDKILSLEALRDEDQMLKQRMIEEKNEVDKKINHLKAEITSLQSELIDHQAHLKQKVEDNRNLNENLESFREEKLLLNAELQMLKSSKNNDSSRGNSLFAEVEENRQKAVGQRELLKIKYLNLKKILSQKQYENNKLKLEIVQIRREDKDDEVTIHRDYSVLIDTLKERVSELEREAKTLQQKLDKHPVIVTEGDVKNFQLVNSILEGARKDAKTLQEELDRRSSHYVFQGHQLFESQKENRRLKASKKKLMSDIDELQLKLDTIKSSKDVEDGISPPATEIAIEYQKQKIVKFKEAIVTHNISQNEEENKENQERTDNVDSAMVKSER